MLLTVITGSLVNDMSFLIVSSAAKLVKMTQFISDSSLSAWSSQVNFLISEWCSLTPSAPPQSKSWRQIKWHWGENINQWRSAVKKTTPDGLLIAIFDFKEPLSNLPRSSFPCWDCDWQPPHLLHVSDMKLRIFLSSGDKFTVGGREKESLPPELIFPSNILQEELLEVECAQVGRLSNRPRWGYVRHTQTSLTPRAVICQHELWSRIFLIHFWGWGQCCLLYLFVLISKKQSNNLPKTAQNPSYFLISFPAPLLFLPPQTLVVHVK